MCMSAPKAPAPPPPPPPPPEPPKEVDEAVSRARSDERRRARAAQGYSSTIASAGDLAGGPAMTAGKTLLGQ
ncbi:MAG: hypothetical protein RLZZ276_124 [Pseudomonadota bacterium]|jgi:hypothetical protein